MSAHSSDVHSSALLVLSVALAMLILSVTILTILGRMKLAALKDELKAVRKSSPNRKSPDLSTRYEECMQRIGQVSQDLDELRGRMQAYEVGMQASLPVWASESIPMQLNRRGQILMLADKGKSAAEIASDLGVPRGEVELLLKVQDLNRVPPEMQDLRAAL